MTKTETSVWRELGGEGEHEGRGTEKTEQGEESEM